MSNEVLPYTANAIVNHCLYGDGTTPKWLTWAVAPYVATRANNPTFESVEDTGGNPAYARVEGTVTIATTAQTDDTLIVAGTIQANANKTVYGAGLFNLQTGGLAFGLSDFTGMPIEEDASIAFVWRAVGK
jgi:hypothetical protein